MAERKRLSDTDTSPSKNAKKIKLIQTALPVASSDRPLCKYGAKCYRKHPDHLKAYQHPSETNDEEEEDNHPSSSKAKAEETSSVSSSPAKQITASSNNSTVSLMELAELTDEKLVSQLYQMEFPKDLYEFWKFCSNLHLKNPRGTREKDFQISSLMISI